jgi:hypothetical protein
MATIVSRIPPAPRYRPTVIEPAYGDPGSVQRLVRDLGAYPNLAGMPGYAGFRMPTMPWFRLSIAAEGPTPSGASCTHHEAAVPGAAIVLRNEPVLAAARQVFGAEIVRPRSVTINVMTPQGPGGAHLDTATFRGAFPSSSWLLAVMGSSGLFDRWAVRVVAALTWIFPGEDGGYEYWPDGPAAPSHCLDGPFGNVALVGDNDYMFHRVRGFGDAARHGDVSRYSPAATIGFADDSWIVVDDGSERARYASTETRISLLWRGVAFEDAHAERVFDEHRDDLDADTLVDVFRRDLTDRGIRCGRPSNHLEDPAWVEVLNDTYGLGGFPPELATDDELRFG